MRKILIFGNSSSGKTNLAKKLAEQDKLAHLDLDTLAWLPESPPIRAPFADSKNQIIEFINLNKNWVIEGGYTDLLEIVEAQTDEIFFLNLNTQQCIENAKNRPWEPHKYESKEAQDENLTMLINWIKEYTKRDDVFSYKSHMTFFENFHGKKIMHKENEKSS